MGRRPRRALARTLRRVRLGFLLIWRKRALPREEVSAQNERMADRQRALAEVRLAAEEYHWAVIGERRRQAATPVADAAPSGDPIATESVPQRPGA